MFPSGPSTIPSGQENVCGREYSVTAPEVLIFPILSQPGSVNHRLPSGPVVTPQGSAVSEMGNSVMTPWTVILPSLLSTANHRLPSGPNVIPER